MNIKEQIWSCGSGMETKDLIVIGAESTVQVLPLMPPDAGCLCDAGSTGSACATSSASSKLIHGGLRYLEHYEFRLVSEALAEREVLLKMAPHIAFLMRFRLPHQPHLRPAWMIARGCFCMTIR